MSYERRVYESVEDSSLSNVYTSNIDEKDNFVLKGLINHASSFSWLYSSVFFKYTFAII